MEDNINNSFFCEFKNRFAMPWSNTAYWFYFFLLIIGIGGIGIWFSFYTDDNIKGVITNIATFFIATLSTSVVSIINCRTIINQKAFSILFIFFLVAGCFMGIIASIHANLFLAIVGYFISLLSWIISTADNADYKESNIKSVIDAGQKKHGSTW